MRFKAVHCPSAAERPTERTNLNANQTVAALIEHAALKGAILPQFECDLASFPF